MFMSGSWPLSDRLSFKSKPRVEAVCWIKPYATGLACT